MAHHAVAKRKKVRALKTEKRTREFKQRNRRNAERLRRRELERWGSRLDLSPEASARRVAEWNRRFPQDHPRMSGTQHSRES